MYALGAAVFAALIFWLRRDAARGAATKAELAGYRDAERARARIAIDRRDPKRLHPYAGRGFRDGASGK